MHDERARVPILIAGAGPTGLVLALTLAKHGIEFRIIAEASEPGEHSRAMVVHARTLEFYSQLGIADDVIAAGIKIERGHLRKSNANGHSREVASFSFGDLGTGLSPYPFALVYPQDDHERYLVKAIEERGIRIEWGTRLTGFTQDAGGVRATISGPGDTVETLTVDYLCGCDGAHSVVRKTTGVGFGGGTYDQLYFVADVRLTEGFDTDLTMNAGRDAFTLVLPVRSSGTQRLIGLVPPRFGSRNDVTFEDLKPEQELLINASIAEVDWFSTYRVHHRVAEHFTVGRTFLLGDAGHLHSPAGGQGMNTGIGDAVNLGWKLAMVASGRASPSLLASYEPERIAFARSLVATTDRAFRSITAGGLTGEIVRAGILPLVFRIGTSFSAGRHAMFRILSQTQIAYPNSPLSEPARGIGGGDRLPWVSDVVPDNFGPLRSFDWQLHVYGEPSDAMRSACTSLALPIEHRPWTPGARAAHLRRDAAYLVRPDGYVALVISPDADAGELRRYAERFAIRFSAPAIR